MVFDLFSNSVGKTNGGMAKAGAFQLFCVLANCNANCFLNYRCSSRIVRLSVASVNREGAVRKRFLVRAIGSRYGGSNTVPCRELAVFQLH